MDGFVVLFGEQCGEGGTVGDGAVAFGACAGADTGTRRLCDATLNRHLGVGCLVCCGGLVHSIVRAKVDVTRLCVLLRLVHGASSGGLELVHGVEGRVGDDLRHLGHNDLFLDNCLWLFRGSDLGSGLAFLCRRGLAASLSLGLHARGIAGSSLPARGTDRCLWERLAGGDALGLLAPLGRHGGRRWQEMAGLASGGRYLAGPRGRVSSKLCVCGMSR